MERTRVPNNNAGAAQAQPQVACSPALVIVQMVRIYRRAVWNRVLSLYFRPMSMVPVEILQMGYSSRSKMAIVRTPLVIALSCFPLQPATPHLYPV